MLSTRGTASGPISPVRRSLIRSVYWQDPVVADVSRSDRKKLLPLRHLVQVKKNVFRRLAAPLATVDRILLPLLRSRVIEPVAVGIGSGDICLLDARHHLLVEMLLEGLGRLHECVGVCVL